jgi:hypothetical protein
MLVEGADVGCIFPQLEGVQLHVAINCNMCLLYGAGRALLLVNARQTVHQMIHSPPQAVRICHGLLINKSLLEGQATYCQL